MSLLEDAKKVIVFSKVRDLKEDFENMEVALAWLKGEVRAGQVSKVKKITVGSNTNNYLIRNLKRAYSEGLISIK